MCYLLNQFSAAARRAVSAGAPRREPVRVEERRSPNALLPTGTLPVTRVGQPRTSADRACRSDRAAPRTRSPVGASPVASPKTTQWLSGVVPHRQAWHRAWLGQPVLERLARWQRLAPEPPVPALALPI